MKKERVTREHLQFDLKDITQAMITAALDAADAPARDYSNPEVVFVYNEGPEHCITGVIVTLTRKNHEG